ncbi:hypothetical protein LOD99_1184 [Oopsacas minuta]|uniref:RCR-type E3 ubiquitin transferase n=1 Tax=Oopsacas minuta TaxID=111878 RepID=A0AAV7K5M6_9METZ|nr:hypothetical protein LOD99_1184 [Oopsacas minuta]
MFGMRRLQRGHRPNRNRRRQNVQLSNSKVCEESEGNSDACKRLSRLFCVSSSPNPSSFAMFVQLHAQESSQELAELFDSLNKAGQIWDSSMDEPPSDKKGKKDKTKDKKGDKTADTLSLEEEAYREPAPLPKMVSLGITGVLEVVAATQFSHPELCLRILEAFHKIVSFNEIGALKNEPHDTIMPLFHLLLEMVQSRDTRPDIASLASSSLIGLILSLGKTHLTLQAVSALMLSQGSTSSHPIPIPEIMRTLQRSVNSALCGRTISRDTIKQSLLTSAKVDTWSISDQPLDTSTCYSSLTCSEHYLFLRRNESILKIGTGYGDTLKGHIYNATSGKTATNKPGWLGMYHGKILYREVSSDGNVVLELSPDTLEVVGEHRVPLELDPEMCLFYSNGEEIGTIEIKGESDVFLHTFELLDGSQTDITLSQTHHLTVGRTILLASGTDEFLSVIHGPPDDTYPASVVYSQSQELPELISVTSKTAVFLSQSGHIFYTGHGDAFGTPRQTGKDEWVSVMIPDDSTFHTFHLSQSGTLCTYIDTNGNLYLSGIGVKGLSPGGGGKKDGGKQHSEIPCLTTTQLPKLESCHCGWSVPLVALVSEDGGLFMFGEMLFEGVKRNDGQIDSPKDVKFQSVSLGEKHALVLSRTHQLFSFGHNNNGECGVAEGELEGDEPPDDENPIIIKNLTEVKLPEGVHMARTGARHSVAVCLSGDAYVWGHNDKGQLGIGDKKNRHKPVRLALPGPVFDVQCGEDFTVFLLQDGRMFGSGMNTNRLLGLPEADGEVTSATLLTLIPAQSDPSMLRLSAGGENILILQKQQMLTNKSLRDAQLLCEKNSLAIVPDNRNSRLSSFSWLKINLRNRAFSVQDQNIYLDCGTSAVALEQVYGNVWQFDNSTNEITQYNGTLASFKVNEGVLSANREPLLLTQTILSPSLCLPNVPHVTRIQAALNLLTCQFCLLTRDKCEILIDDKDDPTEKSKLIRHTSKDPTLGYSVVHRYGDLADVWYHDGSADAVMFQVDKEVLLGGIGIFSGANGILTGQVQVLDSQDKGPALASVDNLEIPQDPSGEIYPAMFDGPYLLERDHWYVLLLKLEGTQALKSGKNGKTEITEDGVMFKFKYTDQSHNGTDTSSGQLPSLYFKFPKVTKLPSADMGEDFEEEAPVQILDSKFYMDVTPHCFESLLKLLEWLCNSVRTSLIEVSQQTEGTGLDLDHEIVLMDIERQLHAIEACLKHCDIYFHKIYVKTPFTLHTSKENPDYIEYVLKFRQMLRDILFQPLPKEVLDPVLPEYLLKERFVKMCQDTYISCFSIFYPTPRLKYFILCEMLMTVSIDEIAQGAPGEMLLVSVLEAISDSSSIGLSSVLQHSQLAYMYSPYKTKYPILEKALGERTFESLADMMNYDAIISKLQSMACSPAHNITRCEEQEPISTRAVSQAASNLLLAKLQELSMYVQAIQSNTGSESPTVKRESDKRFFALLKNWPTVEQDAIAFEVNRKDIWIYGIGVYAGKKVSCEVEMYEEIDDSDKFKLLEKIKVNLTEKDSNKSTHIATVLFSNPVCIQDNRRYHLVCSFPNVKKLGFAGKSGEKEIECLKGLKFTYFNSILSKSGTNCSQGQIPTILYSHSGPSFTQVLLKSDDETNLRDCCDSYLKLTRNLLESATRIIETALSFGVSTELLTRLGNTSFFSQIIPECLVLLIPVAKLYPEITVEVMHILRALLTEVSVVNRQVGVDVAQVAEDRLFFMPVESEHPYPESSITPYNIIFPPEVKWMLVNFMPGCATCQPEDTLKVTVPHPDTSDNKNQPITVLGPYSEDKDWPTEPKIIKGNKINFLFEAATDYLKEENSNKFGFKCDVVGFPWGTLSSESILQLERLLHYVGAQCASSLVQTGTELHLVQPLNALENFTSNARADMSVVYEISNSEIDTFKGLLEGGLRVTCPSVDLALKGEILPSDQTPSLAFIRDFIDGMNTTSGGRLSTFLQTESTIDYTKSSIHIPVFGIKAQWPSLLSVSLADFKGQEMFVKDIRLELSISEVKPGIVKDTSPVDVLYKLIGIPVPKLEIPYTTTIISSNVYTSICFMECFDKYSYEELRFASLHYDSENFRANSHSIQMIGLQDKKYIGKWTPAHPGKYKITLFIEGLKAQTIEHEVSTPDKDEIPPVYPFIIHQKSAMKVTTSDPDVKNVKIFSEPDSTATALGLIPRGKLAYFFEEQQIENDDGSWIRLRPESLKQYAKPGTSPTRGYAQSYLKNKDTYTMKLELLQANVSALQVADSGVRQVKSGTLKRIGGAGSYEIVECGEAGHLIRAGPARNSTPIGQLSKGAIIQVSDEKTKEECVWLKLEETAVVTEGLNNEDAKVFWILGVDLRNYILYARKQGDDGTKGESGIEETDYESFDFKTPTKPPNLFNFAQLPENGKSVFQFEGEKENEKECKTPLCDIFNTKPPEDIHMGLSPDYARCQRTIYSAYLWQESLVVDAMTASAFIKFNPNTPRIKSSSIKKETPKQLSQEEPEPKVEPKMEAKVEPKPEVKVEPKPEVKVELKMEIESKEEPDAKVAKKSDEKMSEQSDKKVAEKVSEKSEEKVVEKQVRFDDKVAEQKSAINPDRSDTPPIEDPEEKSKLELREKVPVTLRYLVNFWDFLMEHVTNYVNSPINIPPLPDTVKERIKADKEIEKVVSVKRKPAEVGDQTLCELCDEFFVNPVTYHMKTEHIGCGQGAKGWGYNSNGNYCSGWAGSCGDGGSGGSTWYIMCESCHTDYLQEKVKTEQLRKFKSQAMGIKKRGGQIRKLLEKPSLTILEENSLFLLELQSPNTSDQELTDKGPPSYTRQTSEPKGPKKPTFKRAETIALATPKTLSFARTISVDVQKDDSQAGWPSFTPVNDDIDPESSPMFLMRPSPILAKLIAKYHREKLEEIGCIPDFLSFISKRHDLDGIRATLQNKMCISRMRVYSLDFIDWLLRVTTDVTCLHDTLWHFMSSFYKESQKKIEGDGVKSDRTEILDAQHPTDLLFGATAVKQVRTSLYELLGTIAELLPKLPIGSFAQEMGVRAWCIPFQVEDHGFIHNCSIFPHISHILSLLEEATTSQSDSKESQSSLFVDEDVTTKVTITVSSREAMLNSITDNSTETFWESGEDCKSRPRTVTFDIPKQLRNSSYRVCVYLDQVRDPGYLSESITVSVGKSKEKKDMFDISTQKITATHVGWITITVPIERVDKFIQVLLKGTKNACRVRQVKLVKGCEGKAEGKPTISCTQMQLASCESQTLRLFRALTSQIFGTILLKKPSDPQKGDNEDIRDQLVGILEENRLSKFQLEMCNEIVKSLSNEFNTMKSNFLDKLQETNWTDTHTVEQVSTLQWNAVRDSILYELLTMLMALAQSELVAKHLTKNASLMKTVFLLLHVASNRCQLLVIDLLCRLLKQVAPEDLAKIFEIEYLPTTSSSIATLVQRPIHAIGILDFLFLAIAKSLEVQIRSRGGEDKSAKSISLFNLTNKDSVMEVDPEDWMWQGAIGKDISFAIVKLIKDMQSGELGEKWKNVSKACIAQAILMMTKVKEASRNVKECRVMKCFWLFMGALCVIDEELCGQLSSGASESKDSKGKQISLCVNHDDDQTSAVVECEKCGTLCAQCDLYLHMPRSKRDHKRVLFKEEEESMKVDLHEGCGRTKLYWLMAMVDTNSLKSMAEFRGHLAQAAPGSGVCRFCDTSGASEMLGLGFVCDDPDCQECAKNACRKALPCGHMCGGVKDENEHLPCLHGCQQSTLKQDGEDMCMVCYTDSLSAAPSVQLKCGHVFHFHCARKSLESKWNGPRILFRFLFCSICQTSPLEAPQLEKLFRPMMTLYDKVMQKARMRLEYENKSSVEALTNEKSKFYQKPGDYALDRYTYYVCFKCNEPYYGGEARCLDVANVSDEYDPSELVCGGCSNVTQAQICPKHGTDYLEYKCRYCCSIATYFCFGTTHFCSPCHDDVGRVTGIPKDELPSCPVGPRAMPQDGDECPLRVKHPPTGEEYALGCGICRNAQSF